MASSICMWAEVKAKIVWVTCERCAMAIAVDSVFPLLLPTTNTCRCESWADFKCWWTPLDYLDTEKPIIRLALQGSTSSDIAASERRAGISECCAWSRTVRFHVIVAAIHWCQVSLAIGLLINACQIGLGSVKFAIEPVRRQILS